MSGGPKKGPFEVKTLRSRLMLALTIALLPVFLLGLVQAWIDARESMTQRRDELVSAADRAIDGLEQNLARAEGYLHVLSDEIQLGRCKPVYRKLEHEVLGLRNVVYFDREGEAVCTYNGEPGFKISNDYWIDRMMIGDYRVRTGAFIAPYGREFLFGLLERVDDENGEYAGSVGFALDAEQVAGYLRNNIKADEIDIAVVSSDGMVFGSDVFDFIDPEWLTDEERGEKNLLIADRVIDRQARDVVIDKIVIGGEDGKGNLYVLLSRPSPGLFSEFIIAPASSIGLPLLAFLFVFGTVWFSIDRLVLKWLKRLNRIALIYAGGRYNLRAGGSFGQAPDEIEEFAQTLDVMAERIEIRDASLREAIDKRDEAVKEIHHRVKNNLQIVTSFLNLQSRQVSDPAARSALAAARHRIDALSIVHRTLYQHERLEIVSLKPFLEGLLSHLSGALGMEEADIEMTWSIVDAERNVDDAIPLALFLVEAVTNAVKHGPETHGWIKIDLTQSEDEAFRLKIENKISEDLERTTDSTGLGNKLMKSFSRQLKAEMQTDISDDGVYSLHLFLK